MGFIPRFSPLWPMSLASLAYIFSLSLFVCISLCPAVLTKHLRCFAKARQLNYNFRLFDIILSLSLLVKASRDIRFSCFLSLLRIETVLLSASFDPIISMYGVFCSWAFLIL